MNERNIDMKIVRIILAETLVLSLLVSSCSRTDESVQIRIPEYPNAVHDQTHAVGDLAQVKRVITSDPFDTVLAFYTEQLSRYDPEIESYTLEDGRQTAIKVLDKKKRSTTVVVQEFRNEKKVAIVFMGLVLKKERK